MMTSLGPVPFDLMQALFGRSRSRARSLMNRRTLLRGAGVCLALPWLESLLPRDARAQNSGSAQRFLICSFPNGAPTDWWETAPAFGTRVEGDDFQLPTGLQAFAPLKSKLLMVSRLGNYTHRQDQDSDNLDPAIEPSHARCMSAFTTCVDADQKARDAGVNDLGSAAINGISVDQLIAKVTGQQTAKASLQTGLGVKPGFFDGRSSAYNQAISWSAPDQPLMRSVNPKAVFDSLVQAGAMNSGGSTDADSEAIAARAATEQSVIDAVRDDANRLLERAGSDDKKVLEQYLDALRSIETDATRVGSSMGATGECSVIAEPGEVPEPPGPQQGLSQGDDGYDHEAHADVMNDLIVMALQCDVTRVITHMLDDARSEFEYRNIPAAVREQIGLEYREGSSLHYHASQHAQGNLDRGTDGGQYKLVEKSNRDFAAINCWLAGKVASLATRLDAIPDGDGTLLDHTLMVFGSEMRTHDHKAFDLPLLLLGGGGTFRANSHTAYAALGEDRQLRDLWFTILNAHFGLNVESFGEDARGVNNALLEEILA
ncbi:MAG TPA: DUF1552 domain-containing protein [Polyangiaceae bacterium]|jgi:hypothetical protein|nr:DUF1552 domain-containing protein [Polyangiaceae bacterium]